jgi:hypothetical protein
LGWATAAVLSLSPRHKMAKTTWCSSSYQFVSVMTPVKSDDHREHGTLSPASAKARSRAQGLWPNQTGVAGATAIKIKTKTQRN